MELPRSSGVLLHPTSLPGPHGVGCLGAAARRFVDRLADAGQAWWQVLPLNPTDAGGSPYASPSALAGNPALIDLDALIDLGWLEPADLSELHEVIDGEAEDEFMIGLVLPAKMRVLEQAWRRWRANGDRDDFQAFGEEHRSWLLDWTLFAALKSHFHGQFWIHWPEDLVTRNPGTLQQVRASLADRIEFATFCQWVFARQWEQLRAYAQDRGISLIGDIPIFPAMDSADVWAQRDLFEVDERGRASCVAGVPPDYFSPTGQKWGNPLYRWDRVAATDFAWWIQRIQRATAMTSLVRIDHFRAFESYWAVPAEAPNAIAGEWRPGPGALFFEAVRQQLGDVPFIAEDLGIITDAVHQLRDDQRLPGMKILQFAFDGSPDHPFLPHTYPERCVAYLGTHDNDTTMGWYASCDESTRHHVRTYFRHGDHGILDALMTGLAQSPAALAIFSAQDLFGLGSEARMNIPGRADGNWRWRMTRDQLESSEPWDHLARITALGQRERG